MLGSAPFRAVTTLVVVAAVVGVAGARSTGAATPAGLVAAYSFDSSGGTVADVSGNGNTGSVSGATWTSAGKYGGAYTFNGKSNIISVPDAPGLDLTTGMTLEAWVKTSVADNKWHTVLMKEQPSMLAYGMYAETGTVGPGPGAEIVTTDGIDYPAYRNYDLATGVWKHVVETYDGSTLTLWVNGYPNASIAAPGSIVTSGGALKIGGNTIWGEYFAGSIDEVRVYNRALSQTEIQSDMNTALGSAVAPPPPPPPSPPPPTADTTAPTTPSNLVLSSSTQTSVTLSWGSSSDNVGVSGYHVYKSAALTGTTSATVYLISSLVCGTSYPVSVDAYDAAGNKSGQAAMTASTTACSAPPPTGPATGFVSPTGLDSSSCTQSAPCKSFDRAYRDAAPGDTVQIAGGSYGAQTINIDSSKTSSADVTFVPAAGAIVTLTGDLQIFGSHISIKGPIDAGSHHKLYIDAVSTPSHTTDVTVDGFNGEDFVVGPASYVTIRNGDFGPSVGCQDGGEYENKVSASSSLPGVAPDHITIENNSLHDQTTANSISCHNGGLNIVGGSFLTIRGNRFFNNMVYDIEFDDFTGSFPLHDVTIENNWFDTPTGALDGAGGCSANTMCKGEADVQVKWNGVAATNWLVRFNSFSQGFSPEWDGAPPSYSNFRILGNTGGNVWSGSKWYACAPAGKSGVTIAYNAWAGLSFGGESGSGTCSSTDVSLGPVTSYQTTYFPYLSSSVTAPDFHLKSGTGAQDLVTPTTADYALMTDIDGLTRPAGPAREAGADEH